MAAHIVTTSVTINGRAYKKGDAVHLTPAEEAANLLSSQSRAVTFRDTTGETVGVSN